MKRMFAIICLVGCATSGFAQGDFSVGIVKGEGFVFGDFSMSAQTDGIGASIGMFGKVGRLHETYASLNFTIGADDRLELGFPVPAYDRFAVSPFSQFHPTAGLNNVGVARSRATQGTMTQVKYLPYGATYVAQNWAASVHAVPDYNTTIVSIGARWPLGDILVSGAAEVVHVVESWDANAKLSARIGGLTAAYFAPSANGLPDHWEFSAQTHIGEALDLRAVVLSSPADHATKLGLSMQSEVADHMDLGIGLVWETGNQAAIDVSLTQHF